MIKHVGPKTFFSKHWRSALLVLIGIATYGNSLHGPFIFDDLAWLDRNPYIQRLWPLYHLLQAPLNNPLEGRPVISLSIAVNYALGERNVIGYHIVNVAIHILAALTLMGIVRRTLELRPLQASFGRDAPNLAFACALLWMVHPIQTECVNYVTQRTESIMGLFYFLTLYCAIRARDGTHRRSWTAGAIVACALGMASKEVMVTAPFMVLLYDLAYRDEPIAQAIRRRSPLYTGLLATWGLLATLMITFPHQGSVGFSDNISSWQYLKCQNLAIVDYLRTILWPDILSIDYGFPRQYSIGQVAPAGIVLLMLLSLTVIALISRPSWGYLGAWFFVTLSPTSSFVPITTEVAAERRVYVPLASLAVLFVVAVYRLATQPAVIPVGRLPYIPRLLVRLSHSVVLRRRVAFLLFFTIGVVLIGRTIVRNREYLTPISIWSDTVRKVPNNPRSHTELGNVFFAAGNVDEAIRHYKTALQIDANWDFADSTHFKLANALYFKRGMVDEAIDHYEAVLQINPFQCQAHYILAYLYVRRGQIDQATRHYEAVLVLAHTLALRGQMLDAKQVIEGVIELDPAVDGNYADYHEGFYLFTQHQYTLAIDSFRRAVVVHPKDLSSHILLGMALMQVGKGNEAVQCFEAALAIDPVNAHIHNQIGLVYLGQEKRELAIQHFREAIRNKPDFSDAIHNLSRAQD